MRPLTLVLMAGLPGTGKTTLALALGRTLGWPVIDKDILKSSLLHMGIEEEVAAATAYDLMFELGKDFLGNQQMSVILDSPLPARFALDRALELTNAAGAKCAVILCLAGQQVRNQRVAERVSRSSQPVGISTTPGDGHDRYDHLPEDTLAVDTTRPLAELVSEVVALLADVPEQSIAPE